MSRSPAGRTAGVPRCRLLSDAAAIIRSKNAGPFTVTVDIFFDRRRRVRHRPRVPRCSPRPASRARVRRAGGHGQGRVLRRAVLAAKVSLLRWSSSTDPFCSDLFGAHLHTPLADSGVKLEPGQVAVVTGAASGIGQALAEAFAARGLLVATADVESPDPDERVDVGSSRAGRRVPQAHAAAVRWRGRGLQQRGRRRAVGPDVGAAAGGLALGSRGQPLGRRPRDPRLRPAPGRAGLAATSSTSPRSRAWRRCPAAATPPTQPASTRWSRSPRCCARSWPSRPPPSASPSSAPARSPPASASPSATARPGARPARRQRLAPVYVDRLPPEAVAAQVLDAIEAGPPLPPAQPRQRAAEIRTHLSRLSTDLEEQP